ncbi:NAD(P)-dependent oxidoreductase [Streptomyces sp. NPDC048255]|uniref:NAD(P)-dependent oxidoreductase n=1 Tax=Streptomyces sp. NPDC048255 TaxID=3154713 RepID=UPI0033DA387E
MSVSLEPPVTPKAPHESIVRAATVAADQFFATLPLPERVDAMASVVITHVLPGQMNFLPALDRMLPVAAVLPKPKSADRRTLDQVSAVYPCDQLDRDRFTDPDWLGPYLHDRAAGRRLVLADIGGYFAPCLKDLVTSYPDLIAGVVEDTENGLRRYLALPEVPCPVFHVARSPLKEPEDQLVGAAIVVSVESLLGRLGEVLSGREACVLGYGKIGAGIAAALIARRVRVTVIDTDPIRQTQAVASGFTTAPLHEALARSELVFSATGARALGMEHLGLLRDGAFIAGGTSADDEFDLTPLGSASSGYRRETVAPGIARYEREGRAFHLLGNGNAVNFVHSSALGPAIHVIKAEILAAAGMLATQRIPAVLHEVPNTTRSVIAAKWLEAFQPVPSAPVVAPAAVAHGGTQ